MVDYEKLFKDSQKEIKVLQEQSNVFHNQLASLVKQNTITVLTAQIAMLNASVIELTRRLHQDSSNSSKPSSSDPYHKPPSKHINSREKTGKKVGAQIGINHERLKRYDKCSL